MHPPDSGISFKDRIAQMILEWTMTVEHDRDGYMVFDVETLTDDILALVKTRDERVEAFVRTQEARKWRRTEGTGDGE